MESNITDKSTLTKGKFLRQYTCTRRVNKENNKIWVVLENGRKFYRIFKNRSLAIAYFKNLKTVYGEMLIQDLKENTFTSKISSKLKIKETNAMLKKDGLNLKDFNIIEDIMDGAIVEDSDKIFDEEEFVKNFSSDDNENEVVQKVDDTVKNKEIKLKEINIKIDLSKGSKEKEVLIGSEYGINFYKSDVDLNIYLLGKEEYYREQNLKIDVKEKK